MVDPDILRRRIDALLGYITRLERFQLVERQTFQADPDTHHLAERYLHLALEAAIDIANHIIADRGFEAPETYRDAFAILASRGVLDPELGARLQSWAGFRNILVHAYRTVDTAWPGTRFAMTWATCARWRRWQRSCSETLNIRVMRPSPAAARSGRARPAT